MVYIEHETAIKLREKIIDYIDSYIYQFDTDKKVRKAFNECLMKLGMGDIGADLGKKCFELWMDKSFEGPFLAASYMVAKHYVDTKGEEVYISFVHGRYARFPRYCGMGKIMEVVDDSIKKRKRGG